MNTHGVKKCSSSNKVLAHTIKCHLEHISFKKSFGKGLRKAKNCKIIAQKQPNHIITVELKFGTIFSKFWKLASNYVIIKLFIYARHNFKNFENFGAMLIYYACKLLLVLKSVRLNSKICRFAKESSLKDLIFTLLTYILQSHSLNLFLYLIQMRRACKKHGSIR